MVGIVVFGLAILSSDAPLLTVHHLKNVAAADAAAALGTYSMGAWKCTAEPVTNCVCAVASLRCQAHIHSLIAQLDAPPRQFAISVRLLRGDPLGSREEGTLEVDNAFNLQVLANQEGMVSVGQSIVVGSERIDLGDCVRVTASPLEKGKLQLRIALEHGTLRKGDKNGAAYRVDHIRRVCEVKLGELRRVRIGPRAKKETWLEIEAREVTSTSE
jgi:hypothetical protein